MAVDISLIKKEVEKLVDIEKKGIVIDEELADDVIHVIKLLNHTNFIHFNEIGYSLKDLAVKFRDAYKKTLEDINNVNSSTITNDDLKRDRIALVNAFNEIKRKLTEIRDTCDKSLKELNVEKNLHEDAEIKSLMNEVKNYTGFAIDEDLKKKFAAVQENFEFVIEKDIEIIYLNFDRMLTNVKNILDAIQKNVDLARWINNINFTKDLTEKVYINKLNAEVKMILSALVSNLEYGDDLTRTIRKTVKEVDYVHKKREQILEAIFRKLSR